MGVVLRAWLSGLPGLVLVLLLVPVGTSTHDPNDFWSTEATIGSDWNDIHGSSLTSVFAVGVSGGQTQVASRQTGSWALASVPDVGGGVSVWTTGGVVYVTGGAILNPNILRYSSGAWGLISLPAGVTRATHVYGHSATDILFTANGPGTGGIVSAPGYIHYDGTTFGTFRPCDTGQNLFQWGDLFGVGGQYYQWVFQTQTGVMLAVIASPPNYECTIVGTAPLVRGTGVIPTDTWSLTTTDADVISSGRVGGTAIGSMLRGFTAALPEMVPDVGDRNSVWGLSGSDVWAVGAAVGLNGPGSNVIHYDGTVWTLEQSTVATTMDGVYCSSATECWMAGGGIIQKLQVNPAVAVPSLTGLQWDPGDLFAHTSEAQCLGDNATLGLNLEPSLGAGGFLNYVLNSETGVVVEQIPTASFFNLNNKHLHTSRSYPAGEYSFLVTADVSGLLGADNWAAETFSIPRNTCFGAEGLHDDHIAQGIDFTHCHVSDNCPTGSGGGSELQLMDLSVQESWTFLFLFGLMVFSMLRGWPWVAGSTTLLLPMVFLPNFLGTSERFVLAIILLVIVFWIHYFTRAGKDLKGIAGDVPG